MENSLSKFLQVLQSRDVEKWTYLIKTYVMMGCLQNNGFQSFTDCCVVHQVFQFIVSTYRWTGPLDRRLLFPKEAWLVSSSNSSSKFHISTTEETSCATTEIELREGFKFIPQQLTERNAYDIALKSKWAVFWTSTNFEFCVHTCKDWCGELGTTWLIHVAGGRCMWKLAFKSLYFQMRIWGKKCWFQIKKGREENLRKGSQSFGAVNFECQYHEFAKRWW